MEPASIITVVEDESFKIFILDNPTRFSTPERLLMLAVLERAYRDLSPIVDPNTRRQAIRWFQASLTCLEVKQDCRYTFTQIAEMMEFGIKEINFILEKVAEAEYYENQRVQKIKKENLN